MDGSRIIGFCSANNIFPYAKVKQTAFHCHPALLTTQHWRSSTDGWAAGQSANWDTEQWVHTRNWFTDMCKCMHSLEAILHQNVHFNPHSTATHEVLKQAHGGMHCSALPIHSVASYPVPISIQTLVQRGNRDWVRSYTQCGSFVLTEYPKELHVRHLILYMQPHNALKG